MDEKRFSNLRDFLFGSNEEPEKSSTEKEKSQKERNDKEEELLSDLELVQRNFLKFIEELPDLTPKEIYKELEKLGYIGQEHAKRALSLMAHRHVKRLKFIYLQKIPPYKLPPKSNYLLVGPTGSGKTYLVELLFKHIIKLPTVIVDITTYSETGYVGQDVVSILTRLLYAADGDVTKAQIGIVCLDEFDKLASGQNNAVFAGAGTTKDVSGLGVQRELLKLLENAVVTVPTEFSHSTYQQHVFMSTENIPFIACGAFSGFKMLSHYFGSIPRIGFTAKAEKQSAFKIAASFTREEVTQTRNFLQYGFLPELIARFDRIVPFSALSREELHQILHRTMISHYQREFKLSGIELKIDKTLIDKIIDQALKRETGARGLRSALSEILEDIAFEAYSEPDIKTLTVRAEGDEIKIEKG